MADEGFQTITKKIAKKPGTAPAHPGVRALLPCTQDGDPKVEQQHRRYLTQFRVNACDRFMGKNCPNHKPFTCFSYHYDSQRRRNPFLDASESTLRYHPVTCPNKDNCPKGDACDKAHNHDELSYHPEVYKTKMGCEKSGGTFRCGGQHCSHAHSKEELRSFYSTMRGSAVVDHPTSQVLDLASYKTQQCSYTNCTRDFFQRDCIYWHSDRDRRRDLRVHWYAAERCARCFELMDLDSTCSDDCALSHNYIEISFHPSNYKTKECRMFAEGSCPRGTLCAYYHEGAERREPAVSLASLNPPKQIVLGDFVGGGMKSGAQQQDDYYGGAPLPYESTGLGTRTFSCDACNIKVNSARQFEEHLEGSKHKANVARKVDEKKASAATAQQSLPTPTMPVHTSHPQILTSAALPQATALPYAQLLTTALAQDPRDPFVHVLISRAHEGPVTTIAFLPDGSKFITANLVSAYVFDSEDGHLCAVLTCASIIECLSVSKSGNFIACGTTGGCVVLWSLKTSAKHRTLEADVAGGGAALSVSFVSGTDDALVAGYKDGAVRLFDVSAAAGSGGRMVRVFGGHQGAVLSVSIAADARTMATGSADGTVRLWDLSTGACSNELVHSEQEGDQPPEEVLCVSFSEDGHRLACACGSYAWIWVWENGSVRTERYLESPFAVVNAVAFNIDCSVLVTANNDGVTRLWGADGDPVMSMSGHENGVTGASWSLRDSRLVTCGGDGTFRLYWPRDLVVRRKEASLAPSVFVFPAAPASLPAPISSATTSHVIPAPVTAPNPTVAAVPAASVSAPVTAPASAPVPSSPALSSTGSTPLLQSVNGSHVPSATMSQQDDDDELFWGDAPVVAAAAQKAAPAAVTVPVAVPSKPKDKLVSKVVCQICFRAFMHKPTQVLVEQDASNPGQCRQCKSQWKPVRVSLTLKNRWMDARSRPENVEAEYRLCVHTSKGTCIRGNGCSFAHSNEELEIWNRDREIAKQEKIDRIMATVHAQNAPLASALAGPSSSAPTAVAAPTPLSQPTAMPTSAATASSAELNALFTVQPSPGLVSLQEQLNQLNALAAAADSPSSYDGELGGLAGHVSGDVAPDVAPDASSASAPDGVTFVELGDLARPKGGLSVGAADGGPLEATVAEPRDVTWILEAVNKGPATERLENVFVNAAEDSDFTIVSVEFSDPAHNFEDTEAVLTLKPGEFCRAVVNCRAGPSPSTRSVWVIFEFSPLYPGEAPVLLGSLVSVDCKPGNPTSVPASTDIAPSSLSARVTGITASKAASFQSPKSLWDSVVTPPMPSSAGSFSSVPPLSLPSLRGDGHQHTTIGSLWDSLDGMGSKPMSGLSAGVPRVPHHADLASLVDQLARSVASLKERASDELRGDVSQDVADVLRKQLLCVQQQMHHVSVLGDLQKAYADLCGQYERAVALAPSSVSSSSSSRLPPGFLGGMAPLQMHVGGHVGGHGGSHIGGQPSAIGRELPASLGFGQGGGFGFGIGNGLGNGLLYGQSF